MKPAPFTHHAPNTIADAVSLLADLEMPKLLAGGQSLMPMLNMRYVFADNLIDLNRVAGLEGVRQNNGIVEIGAMTRQLALQHDQIIAEHLPIMPEALHWVGHVATRSRGTIGGSLSHLDPAAELPAIIALYGGTMIVQSKRGTREIAAADWFQGYMTPALEPDELLVAIKLTAWNNPYGYSFIELARRHGDFAMSGAATLIRLNHSSIITEAAVVVFGVELAPARLVAAEQELIGQTATLDTFKSAARHALALEAIEDVHASSDYRRSVAATLVRRSLVKAAERAAGQG